MKEMHESGDFEDLLISEGIRYVGSEVVEEKWKLKFRC